MRMLLAQLAVHTTIGIISGRDRADVEKMVGLSDLHYAGSHGFDIVSADGKIMEQEQAQSSLPELEEVEYLLGEQLQSIAGVHVERKRFAIAVHYREAAQSAINRVEDIVDQVLKQYEGLRKRQGKKIFEIQPDIPWNKGLAVCWLLNQLGLNQPTVTPIYIGDDITDEDAFVALGDCGITIRVGIPNQPTHANYFLHNPDEVQLFFQLLLQQLKG